MRHAVCQFHRRIGLKARTHHTIPVISAKSIARIEKLDLPKSLLDTIKKEARVRHRKEALTVRYQLHDVSADFIFPDR